MQKLLILPSDADRVNTRHENADRGPKTTMERLGGEIVEEASGEATLITVVKLIPAEQISRALDANPQVKWVQLPFAGVDPYVSMIRNYPEVTFTSAKGIYAPPVAEHALTLTLALLRHLPERVRATSWGENKGKTLNGSRIVIVGGGGIGTELVRLFSTWDTHITVVRRTDREVAGADQTVTSEHLDEVLPGADAVVLATAATDQTNQMITSRQLELMNQDAVLVNIARGTVVDTDALVSALAEGQIAAAGIDVTDPEPLPDGHPLWTEPNCLITPHTADTPEMCIPLLDARIDRNLQALYDGAKPEDLEGLVDPVAGY